MNLNTIKTILVITPNRLGDTIFCTPFIRMLKTYFPQVQIDILAPTALSAEVFQNSPYINKVLLVPKIAELLSRKNSYDLVIRAGTSEYTAESLALFNAEKIDVSGRCEPNVPAADNYLQYFAKLFALDLTSFLRHYDLYPSQKNEDNIKSLFAQNQVDLKQTKLIGFHLGCHSLAKKKLKFWQKPVHSKVWLLENFISLGKALTQMDSSIRIVITGSKEEERMGRRFCRKIPNAINLINKTKVLDLVALMKYLRVFVANDTGVMHIGSTTNVSLVVLCGLTDPTVTGPYPKDANRIVLQKKKINGISVTEVLQTITNLM